MEAKYERAMLHVSGVCLLGGVSLILLGLAGYAPNPTLVVGMLAAAAALYASWYRTGITTLAWLWAGPLLAAGVMLAGYGASPGELQSLGGVVGLIGMANLLLRPVYHYALAAAASINQIRIEINEERRRQRAEEEDGATDGGHAGSSADADSQHSSGDAGGADDTQQSDDEDTGGFSFDRQ